MLLDIPSRTMRRVQIPGNMYVVEAVAFAPDGNTLAVAIDRGKKTQTDLVVIGGLTQRLAAAGAGSIVLKDCPKVETPHAKGMEVLAFSPDGRRLLAGGRELGGEHLDVPAGGSAAAGAGEGDPGRRADGGGGVGAGRQAVPPVLLRRRRRTRARDLEAQVLN